MPYEVNWYSCDHRMRPILAIPMNSEYMLGLNDILHAKLGVVLATWRKKQKVFDRG